MSAVFTHMTDWESWGKVEHSVGTFYSCCPSDSGRQRGGGRPSAAWEEAEACGYPCAYRCKLRREVLLLPGMRSLHFLPFLYLVPKPVVTLILRSDLLSSIFPSMCEGQGLMSSILSITCHLIFLRQGVLLNLDVINLARLAGQ